MSNTRKGKRNDGCEGDMERREGEEGRSKTKLEEEMTFVNMLYFLIKSASASLGSAAP